MKGCNLLTELLNDLLAVFLGCPGLCLNLLLEGADTLPDLALGMALGVLSHLLFLC